MSNSLKRKRQVDSFKRRIQTTQSKIAIAGVVGILIGFFVSLSLMGGLYSANPHVFAISDNAITRYLGLYDGEKATIGFLDGDEIIIGRFDGNNILIESDGKEVSSVTLGEMSLDEYAAVGDVAMISGAITNIGARSECTDSDGGFAYHEKGKTSDGMITREDRCLIDGMTLKEFFCMDGLVSSVRNDCSAESKVCLNGICAEEVASGIAGISTGGGGGEECPTEADHCCWGSGGSFCTLDQFSKCKKIRKESECSIKDNKGYKTECCEWEIPSAYTKCTKSEDTARSCCYNTVEKEYYREGDCVKGDKFQYSYNDGYCGCVKSTEPCFLSPFEVTHQPA